MRVSVPISLGIAVVLTAAACGGPPPPPPPPQPDPDSIAAEQARRDSIRMAEESARREEAARVERERAERQAAADSAAAEARRMAQENEMVRGVFAQTIHFDFDKSDIKPEYESVLSMKAQIMNANPAMTITIVGHADERGSDEYNIALGNRRALAARAFLVNLGIAEDRIMTNSMGESQPLVDEHNEEAWRQNRRDEFQIAGTANLMRPQM